MFAAACAFLAAKARAEERGLRAIFPEYERYRQRIPGLLPAPAMSAARVAALLEAIARAQKEPCGHARTRSRHRRRGRWRRWSQPPGKGPA